MNVITTLPGSEETKDAMEGESVAKILEFIHTQKLELKAKQLEKYGTWTTRMEGKRKRERLARVDCAVKHPAKWNPSVHVSDLDIVNIQAWEPNPNGKEFKFEGKSIWPVVHSTRSRFDASKHGKKPWYAVRSGEVFQPIEHSTEMQDSKKRKTEHNSHRAMHDQPWLCPSSAPGRVFSEYT